MNLKNTGWILFVLFVFLSQIQAQEVPSPESISIEDAVHWALKHHPDIEKHSLQSQMALKKIEEVKWQKIPDIYANFDLRYNIIVPTTPVPAIAFDPNANTGDFLPLKFMTKWRNSAGINLSYDLFNPETFGKVKEATQEAAIADMDEKMTNLKLTYLVQQDYISCLIAKEQLLLATSDTLSKHNIWEMLFGQYEAGRLKVNELNNILLEKNEAISSFLAAQKIYKNAVFQLLTDMGFDLDKKNKIALSDNLTQLLSTFQDTHLEGSESLSLKKLGQEKVLTELQLKNTKLGYLPVVSLNGFWGTNYFNNQFNIFDTPYWYGNTYVGLNVSLPITRGLDRLKKVESLDLKIRQNQIDYKIQELQQKRDLKQLENELNYRKADLKLKETNKQLSRENFETDTELLNNGRMLVEDWTKSNFRYLQASTSYLQAVYEYLIAKIELDRTFNE
ncbi:MAG: TolC family protein [Chitinophagales bacterium]|nr:TolC family protein [Chitinophagales bacterium]